MLAGEFLELRHLLGVAGQTRIGDVTRQHDVERRMGVLVATEAAGQFVVFFSAMALAAFGDDVFCRDFGGVAVMAVETSDFLVAGAVSRNVSGCLGVTLHAVVSRQLRGSLRGLYLAAKPQAERRRQGQACYDEKPDLSYSIHRSSSVHLHMS